MKLIASSLIFLVSSFCLAGGAGGGGGVRPVLMAGENRYAYFIKSNGVFDAIALGSWVNGKWTQKVYQLSVTDTVQNMDAIADALEQSEASRDWAPIFGE